MLKTIRRVDKKAPRFRWSSQRYIVLNKDLFKGYQEHVENPIQDWGLFKTLVEDYNELIKDHATNNRDGVKLPAMMGIVAVCSFKPKNRIPTDWAAADKYGLRIKEQNLHTGGLACKIVYSVYSAKYKFKNWALWRFEGNRDFKTRVSTSFIRKYQYYKRMDNKSHVSKMFNDNYITKIYDHIGTNIEHSGDEQDSERRQQDYRSLYLQRSTFHKKHSSSAGGQSQEDGSDGIPPTDAEQG